MIVRIHQMAVLCGTSQVVYVNKLIKLTKHIANAVSLLIPYNQCGHWV